MIIDKRQFRNTLYPNNYKPEALRVTCGYIKKLRAFSAYLVKRLGITVLFGLTVLGAFLAITHYVFTRSLVDALLYLMGFWPAGLSFYAILKFPPSSRKRKTKTAVLWPAFISFISYFVSFFAICNLKYAFRPPESFFEEVLFLGRVIPSSLALSFFMAGIVAKLDKARSELYFCVSGFFGVITGVLDTAAVALVLPPPSPLGLSSSILVGLILGSLTLIIVLVINMLTRALS